MKFLWRVVSWVVAFAASNISWLVGAWAVPWAVRVLVGLACLSGYILVSWRPATRATAGLPRRMVSALRGYELLLTAGLVAITNLVAWLWGGLAIGAHSATSGVWVLFTVNLIVGICLSAGLALNGFIRVAIGSAAVPWTTKLLVVLFWWFPPATIGLLHKMMVTIKQEAASLAAKAARDDQRLASQVCRTRHPLLLVHGIFFRDWPIFNYWGRIPAALEANGATLFHGGQQSSTSVADSAAELAAKIRQIVAETGCGKLNVIAHSKGGLDMRWAISQLGVADLVASLTTINTPHRGCSFARELMERIPDQAVNTISEKYDALFAKLGDPDPDFLAGIVDLTDSECARLNEAMPDAAGVYYRSVGSQMASRFASPFPLSLGFSLIQPREGDNDGLVSVQSMPWGDWLGVVQSTGKHGISHGDMIDLLRRDIGGFDVCEFYVGLVASLRERGL